MNGVLEEYLISEETTDLGIKVKSYNFNGIIPEDSCVNIVTSIASVCYKSEDTSSGSQRLFNMLMKEGAGALPSSALEYVPINMDFKEVRELTGDIMLKYGEVPSITKYGFIVPGRKSIWVTNMRALYTDYSNGFISKELHDKAMRTKIEFGMPVHKIENISMYTLGQLVRHREASYQIKSRRYCSDSKSPFTFNLEALKGTNGYDAALWHCDNAMFQYQELIDHGAKKETARGMIPQFATTELWFKFTTPQSRRNFIALRASKKSQDEIRGIAELIKNI